MKIPFNKPYIAGNEFINMRQAIDLGKLSGNGFFTQKCQQFFTDRFGCKKTLLTTSCTDALEMSAILANIQPGDEVIIPSFTFPSTANAFLLRGAKAVFIDSCPHHPNMDARKIESLITEKTKAIVPVHYAGMTCDMDTIMAIAAKHHLYVIEDAAQAIDSYYKGRPLGTIGHLGAFSFHETKNISSGEGGLLVMNKKKFFLRGEIIWEKGTNRASFFRGEVNKYGWVDIGSSFLPSELIAAVLFAQLEKIEEIQEKRIKIWQQYYEGLRPLADAGCFKLPIRPPHSTNNGHLFYIICRSYHERQALIEFLKINGILAIFHYLPLHKSKYYKDKHDGRSLPNSIHFSRCLLRLPFCCKKNKSYSLRHLVSLLSLWGNSIKTLSILLPIVSYP